MRCLCRDCFSWRAGPPPARCARCGSPRIVAHEELATLGVGHLDCDCFYAAIEKRDDPALADRPVIVGGGRRGVVSTACYIARIRGVRSAMPMFKALEACPDAVVIRPRMAAYEEASRHIRRLMEEVTPLVQPLSLDEAFLDLRGTERVHGAPPAEVLARLLARIEAEVGVTASVGLSHNKSLAKIASDLDKPRGFSVIGAAETLDFLADKPVSLIWGVGRALQAKLEADGLKRIGDIRREAPERLLARYGAMGKRLWEFAHGRDARAVSRDEGMKSISSETTFEADHADAAILRGHLWRLSVKVADRAKAKGVAGGGVTLKLKSADFRLLTRQTALPAPTNLADAIYKAADALLARALAKGPFRLIGVGIHDLGPDEGGAAGDLLDPDAAARAAAERATDRIRARFGAGAIVKGRSLS